MKLVVMSDSHGNIDFVQKVIKIAEDEKADYIIHLGDDSSDMIHFKDFNIQNVIVVPGVYEREYEDKTITNLQNRILKKFGDVRVLITHTRSSHANDLPQDIKPEELIEKREVDIVLFGHTHLYYADVEDSILFVNPGHLKVEDKKGMPPTYAVLEIIDRTVKVRIIGMNMTKYINKTFSL
jgi:hypothetical protein